MMTTHETPADLHDAMRSALAPILLEAQMTAHTVAAFTSIWVYGDPLQCDVVLRDHAGREQGRFCSPGSPAVAEALAALLTAELSALSTALRARVAALLGVGAGALVLMVDAADGSMAVVLELAEPDADPICLNILRPPETVH